MSQETDDTMVLCQKAIALEMVLKEVRVTNAFQIHSDYRGCIENECPGFDPDCEYYQRVYLKIEKEKKRLQDQDLPEV